MYGLMKRIPFVRGFTYTTPPYHTGSVIEIRHGLQVLRILSKNTLWKLRKRDVSKELESYLHTLDEDGILILENFLPSAQFDEVLSEFEKANRHIQPMPYKGSANTKLYRAQISASESPENFPSIIKYFQENEMLRRLAAAVIKRKVTTAPDIRLDTYQNLDNQGLDNDVENILHADLHTPTVKMFFYLNDVNETNGAFVYAKGSHKLTLERVKHEYELSVRQAKMKKGLKIPDALLARRGKEVRNIISPKYFDSMRVTESQICVKPNTLVVANNMGFHRRGEFAGNSTRKALVINFRNSEKSVL